MKKHELQQRLIERLTETNVGETICLNWIEIQWVIEMIRGKDSAGVNAERSQGQNESNGRWVRQSANEPGAGRIEELEKGVDRGNRESRPQGANGAGGETETAEETEKGIQEVKKLKPCPFCAGDDFLEFAYPFKRKPGIKGSYVRCNRCGASSGMHETIEDARNAWNVRKEGLWKRS